ncbi:hypothetical protein TCAL_16150 [Tigriopus californicus]|uniref:Uncharacterized protein n=1 Tax=Tigriopus californicus TaxID=6832 RepID=A0A553P3S1_TIGCA|nr:hypothetical protein TCAL_16150 [Tigriopus californicus]
MERVANPQDLDNIFWLLIIFPQRLHHVFVDVRSILEHGRQQMAVIHCNWQGTEEIKVQDDFRRDEREKKSSDM